MKTETQIFQKRKKLRKRLRKAIFDYGEKRITDNCKFWTKEISGPKKCTYNTYSNQNGCALRECPNSSACLDFSNKHTSDSLKEKYLNLIDDDVYLAQNYRDLFILNWVLEEDEEANVYHRLIDSFVKMKEKMKGMFSHD